MNYEISFHLKNAYEDKYKFTYHCTFLKECENLISKFSQFTISECVIYDLKADKTILIYDAGSFLVSPQIPYYFVKSTCNLYSLIKLNF